MQCMAADSRAFGARTSDLAADEVASLDDSDHERSSRQAALIVVLVSKRRRIVEYSAVITFDPWTFFVLSVVGAASAYRIHAKRGFDNPRFAFAAVLAMLLFAIGIYVGPCQPS